MQYIILPYFQQDTKSYVLVQISVVVLVSMPKKVKSETNDLISGKKTTFHLKLFKVLEEHREDLLHGIHKGRKRSNMLLQQVTYSLQTSIYLSYTTNRKAALLCPTGSIELTQKSSMPMFKISCPEDNITYSSSEGSLYHF